MSNEDPILESALEEALGGKSPPDLIAQTLARAAQPASTSSPLSARPRPHWRAWGTGLAAAAVVTITVAYLSIVPSAEPADGSGIATGQTEDVTEGNEDLDDRQFDNGSGGIAGNAPSGGVILKATLDDLDTKHLTGKDRDPNSPTFDSGGIRLRMSPRVQTGATYEAEPTLDPASSPKMIHRAHGSNPFVDTEDDALSTFALEHDTGSYTLMRNYLAGGNLPPEEAIRVEEFINYFDYRYDKPRVDPFAISIDGAPSRYGADLRNGMLLRVGVQARQIDPAERKPAILTFVIDVSGSMRGESRLGLVKQALELLVDQLRDGDRVGIAIYGDDGRMHLPHLDIARKSEIVDAIRGLQADGSTNAEDGLRVGYTMATEAFQPGCTNRVILCSDGVANVGATGPEAILKTIVEHRRRGITLSSLGFGMGNMNDHLMEQLGDKGDGHYAYIDTLDEAKRVFVDNLTGALEVVGRDVKIQVEFNPAVVQSYRLIGYVNRDMKDQDFRNDAVDGGEIGAGHAATALYEIKLKDFADGWVARANVRYKLDEQGDAQEIARGVLTRDLAPTWEHASLSLRLAANIAEYAEILSKSFYAKGAELAPVINELEALAPQWRDDKVDELLDLAKKANDLMKED